MGLKELNTLLRDREAYIWVCPYCGTILIADNRETHKKLKEAHLNECSKS